MKRVQKVRKKCANPLFEKWLLEWKDEARAKSLPTETHFGKAIISLQKYPLPLETGRDCILLKHFGAKLCAMLDKKLKKHLSAKGTSHSFDSGIVYRNHDIVSDNSQKISKSQDGNSVNTTGTKKKKIGPKTHADIPDSEIVDRNNKISSDVYKKQDEIAVSTTEIQKKKFVPKKPKATVAKRSREHSLSPSASSCGNDSPIIGRVNYVDEEVVKEAFTEDNAARKKPKATKVLQDEEIIAVDDNSDDVIVVNSENTEGTLVVDRFQMAPNSFDVFLLVDNHETAGTKTKAKNDATISELNKLKTQYEVRNLKVGDFGWIARCRKTKKELVLPYLVERKRMDDLASSIKDGRFPEQKFRLKQCGVPNIIYLLESHGKNQFLGMPLESLLQAAINSYVQDGCQLKFTDNHRQSIQYLSNLTTYIDEFFKDKHLVSSAKENLHNDFISKKKVTLMEFELFNRAALKTKTFTVKEMFVKHLLQLKGISVEKALAIVELYPTPVMLFEAFQRAGDGANNLLASIKAGKLQKSLGPALSKSIFELYTRNTLEQ